MALYIPQSILHLARSLYVRPETYGPNYVHERSDQNAHIKINIPKCHHRPSGNLVHTYIVIMFGYSLPNNKSSPYLTTYRFLDVRNKKFIPNIFTKIQEKRPLKRTKNRSSNRAEVSLKCNTETNLKYKTEINLKEGCTGKG